MKRTLLASLLALAAMPAFAQDINTVAGGGANNPGGGGQATDASLGTVFSVNPIPAAEGGGFYIGTYCAMRRVDAGGIITAFTGLVDSCGFADGAIADARFAAQLDATLLAPDGSLYISDGNNSRVRKVGVPPLSVVTVVGNGSTTPVDDVQATASGTVYPVGLALDAGGKLYIAEYYGCRVRKVDADGVITTVAGNGTCATGSDGTASGSTLNYPWGLRVGPDGALYVSEYGAGRIRRIDLAADTISTVAGSSGINGPLHVDFDADGNLYVAAFNGHVVHRITPAGVASVVAGDGTPGFSGDGGPAVSARLTSPRDVKVDVGRLLIADGDNGRIREVVIAGLLPLELEPSESDATPPMITPIIDPAAPDGDNGWYVGDVGVGWDVSDPESAIASSEGCGDSYVTADTIGTSFTCTATSAGGENSATSATIKRDATAPTLAPTVPNPLLRGQSYSASANASDATSGLASASCGALDTSSTGSKSTSCTATDNAGNVSTVTLNYAVTTTCSNDGYKGTQLTWCQNICEKGYTGATLDMWIHRWVNRYRELPNCQVDPQPQPE